MDKVISLISDHPIAFIFIFLVVIALIVFLSIGLYRLVDKLLNKDINVSKNGLSATNNKKKSKHKKDSDEELEELEEQIENPTLFIASNQELTGLINLIIDLPDIAIKKNEAIHNLKERLISEQKQDFCARLKSYRVDIRKEYQMLLGVEDTHDNRVRLFAYWFSDLFEDVDEEILSILKLNGLNEKTPEQLEDTLTRLYDSTFSKIIEATDLAPKFIEKPVEVRKIIEKTKTKFRDSLQASLNHAKKLRTEYQMQFDKIETEYLESRDAIIARDFPNLDMGIIKERC